jgi:hypothetical protein
MDATTASRLLEQHFEYSASDPERAHEMYAENAVLEFPQSGERFAGVENMRPWRSEYPLPTVPEIQRVRGGGDLWVFEITVTYGDEPPQYGVAIWELEAEKVVRETIYVSEGWEAPEWRAKWRSAP